MTRVVRLVLVVAGLSGAGMILGGLAGGGALATSFLIRGIFDPYRFGDILVAARLGGVLGALFGPACAFGFLRRLPLWVVLGVPTLATYLGGVLGEFASAGFLTAPGAFLLSMVVLHGRGDANDDQNALPTSCTPTRV